MSESAVTVIFVFFTAVLPCLIFGYLIAFRNRRGLIAGWSDSKVSKPKASGRIIGISLMVMAVLIAIVTLLWSAKLIAASALAYYLIPITLIPLFGVVYINLKFGIK